MTSEVVYSEPDGTVTAYDESPEERAARIAERAAKARKLLRMTKGEADVIERAQARVARTA